MDTGESYIGPINIGYYTDSKEVWMEFGSPDFHVDSFLAGL